jgi:hypothetical protein
MIMITPPTKTTTTTIIIITVIIIKVLDISNIVNKKTKKHVVREIITNFH